MERTIGVVTEGGRGVLGRISGLMERRGFQVKGVTAGATQRPGVARYTLVIGGGDRQADQAMRQIRKMVETVAVEDLSVPGSVERCMMLLKFAPSPEQRDALFETMKGYPHSVADDRGAPGARDDGPGAMLDDCLEKVKGLGLVESVKRPWPLEQTRLNSKSHNAKELEIMAKVLYDKDANMKVLARKRWRFSVTKPGTPTPRTCGTAEFQ